MVFVFFFKQKTAYEMRISDWSSYVCSSDLASMRMRAFVRMHESASCRIRTCTETWKRNCAGQEKHGYGSPILWKAADADFRKSTKADWSARNEHFRL